MVPHRLGAKNLKKDQALENPCPLRAEIHQKTLNLLLRSHFYSTPEKYWVPEFFTYEKRDSAVVALNAVTKRFAPTAKPTIDSVESKVV